MARKVIAVFSAAFLVSAVTSAAALEAVSELEVIEEAVVTLEDPRVGYYVSEAKKTGFVLDRTRDRARVRFDKSREILILDMVPGPQGVTYFKDEFGTTILRLMPYGGATVYGKDGSEAGAFGRQRKAKPLELKPRGINHVRRRSSEIREKFSNHYAFKVAFDFQPGLDAIKAEALEVVAEELTRSTATLEETSTAMPKEMSTAMADVGGMSSGSAEKMSLASVRQKSVVEITAPGTDRNLWAATAVADAMEVVNVALTRLVRDDLAL
jgi:hypothetical protein